MPTLRHLTLTLLLGALSVLPLSAHASDATWQALQEGGLVILMRHSLAPGIGDPRGFERGRCETQRNLSAAGRAQAEAAGRAFRERDIPIAAVYSSSWCRARGTAELMALGPITSTPWLDSFFRGRGDQASITQTAQEQITAWQGPGNLVLVTHQVNITALGGGGVGSGEMIVVRPTDNSFRVVGRLSVSGQ